MNIRSSVIVSTLLLLLFTWGCKSVPKQAYDNLQKEHKQLMRKNSALQKKYYNAKSQNQRLRQRLKKQGESLEEFRDLASDVNTDATGAVKLSIPQNIQNDVRKVKVNGQTALRMSNRIIFQPGSAQLSDSGRKTLNKIIPVLQQFGKDVRFVIEGHTDSQPIKQSKDKFPSNWHLSAHRAISVAQKLIKEGINTDLIEVVGQADTNPIASNDTEEGRRKNRRVEIIIIPRI